MAKEEGYGFNHYAHPLGEPTKIVLIGERHDNHIDSTFQRKLIELLEPETVMHEFFDPNDNPSKSETVRHIKRQINRWSEEYNIQLRPCDLPYAEIQHFQRMVYQFLASIPEFRDEKYLESIIVDDNAVREMAMGKLIRAEAAKTKRPLIAIVGGSHAGPESRVHEELRVQRAIEVSYRPPLGYITINQDNILSGQLQRSAKFFE